MLFTAGMFAAFQQAELVDLVWCLFLPIFSLLVFSRNRMVTWLAAVCAGFLYVNFYAHSFGPAALDESWLRKEVLLIGTVADLPQYKDKSVRFVFDIEAAYVESHKVQLPPRVRLSWYGAYDPPKVGEKWQLMVRLKPPHGFANPGGFDFERYLYEQGIGATGYVRKSSENKFLAPATSIVQPIREWLRERIDDALVDAPMRGFIKALVIGDRGELSQDDWRILNNTGTNHLMAISGLHIGLVAGLVLWIVARCWRLSARACLWFPATKVAVFFAFLSALVYAALAGFTVPTQRAMLMFGVLAVSLLMGFQWRPLQILTSAWVLVMLYDPFALLSAGTWLSFLAVMAILYALQLRRRDRALYQWGRVQWIITIALVPVLLWYFQRLSLISPLANVLAVPWMSFIVVPLALLGALFSGLPDVATLVWQGSATAMQTLWWLLQRMADLPLAAYQSFAPGWWATVLAVLGVVCLILPRGVMFRSIGIIFLIPALAVKPQALNEGEVVIDVLDVGQGLAVVARTRDHVLLYDTGPRFSEDFNAGDAVILPFLREHGVEQIDTLVLSHGDSDHAGGLDAVFAQMPVTTFYNGASRQITREGQKPCRAGTHWQVNQVRFSLVYPENTLQELSDNNGSCVLQIHAGEHAILIPGDIEKKAERFLLESLGLGLRSDVLLIPHHGSKTSSTPTFIEQVSPGIAINAAGYANRYRLPNAKVMRRYTERNMALWNTAQHGAIRLTLSESGIDGPHSWRRQKRRFWQHRMTN